MALLLIGACTSDPGYYTNTPFDGTPQNGSGETQKECYVASFTQSTATQTKLDTLLVLDVSGSMDGFRVAMAAQFDKFYSKIITAYPDLDFQIGVLLMWSTIGDGYWGGKFYNAPKNNCSATPVMKGIGQAGWDSAVKAQLQCILADSMTPGSPNFDSSINEEAIMNAASIPNAEGEAGFLAVQSLLSGSQLNDAKAQGFFRSDAALSVIFASDENEICSLQPGATLAERLSKTTDGPGDTEYNFWMNASARCDGVTPLTTYAKLLAATPSGRLSVGALARTNRLNGSAYNKHFGLGYLGDPSFMFQGIVDIAGASGYAADLSSDATAVANALAGIGNAAYETLIKQTQFPMPNEAAEVQWVKVDGSEVPFQFQPAANALQLAPENAGSHGQTISVQWCKAPMSPEN